MRTFKSNIFKTKAFKKLVKKHKKRILDEELEVDLETEPMVAKRDDVLAEMLSKALERCEGMYSKIPECCITAYIGGLKAKHYLDHSDIKVRNKFSGWGYVPCQECFDAGNKVKIKHNGISFQGKIILQLLHYFSGKRT